MSSPSALPNGPPSLSTILLQAQGATPQDLMFYTTLALTLSAMVTSLIWTQTVRYFDYFHRTDPGIVQLGIAFGTSVATGCFAINIAQTYKMAHHAMTDYATIMRFDLLCGLSLNFTGGVFCLAAGSFFSWRAWKLSGGKVFLIPIYAACNAAAFALVLIVAVKSFAPPQIRFDTLLDLGKYYASVDHWLKIWAWVTVGTDTVICTSMIFLLWRSKESLFNTETGLVKRLASLVTESMLPPVVVLLILSCTTTKSAASDSWTRMLTFISPLLYWQSLLLALVSRHTVRKLLDQRLAANGVGKLSGEEHVYVTQHSGGKSQGEV